MRIDTLTDGSFRFYFPKEEKALGLQLLEVLSSADAETRELIEHAKYRVIMAGVVKEEVKSR